jgi:hypothetical protein
MCSLVDDLPEGSIHRHSDERHNLRTEPIDLLLQNLPTVQVLVRLQHIDPWTRARDEVRHPDAPLGQAIVVLVRDRLRDDARFIEQAPETIGRTGEVMAGRRGDDARVDADEQDADARLDPVNESQMCPRGLRILGHELVVQRRARELQL